MLGQVAGAAVGLVLVLELVLAAWLDVGAAEVEVALLDVDLVLLALTLLVLVDLALLVLVLLALTVVVFVDLALLVLVLAGAATLLVLLNTVHLFFQQWLFQKTSLVD